MDFLGITTAKLVGGSIYMLAFVGAYVANLKLIDRFPKSSFLPIQASTAMYITDVGFITGMFADVYAMKYMYPELVKSSGFSGLFSTIPLLIVFVVVTHLINIQLIRTVDDIRNNKKVLATMTAFAFIGGMSFKVGATYILSFGIIPSIF